MKIRIIVLSLSVITLFSCNEPLIIEPVEICNNYNNGNESNPYNSLYQEILDEYVGKGLVGVSVAINTKEYGWWIGSAGMASIEDNIAMQPGHLHFSASMVKTYTATLIMRLVEDNIISLNDPIKDYLPEEVVTRIPNAESANIKHLLTHTAGFKNSSFSPESSIDIFNNPQYFESKEFILENYLYDTPALADPGEVWNYSNTGFFLLGMIIEEASNQKLGDYFEQEIIKPLGLVNTYYQASEGYPDSIPKTVNNYFEPYPGELQNCSVIEFNYAKSSMGEVGLIATPYDYAFFCQQLFMGNILDSTTLTVMMTDEIESIEGIVHQCLGIKHVNRRDTNYGDWYGHDGSTIGIRGRTFYFPNFDATISLIMNQGIEISGEKTESNYNLLWWDILDVTFFGERGLTDD